jgi:hypothetical protein
MEDLGGNIINMGYNNNNVFQGNNIFQSNWTSVTLHFKEKIIFWKNMVVLTFLELDLVH